MSEPPDLNGTPSLRASFAHPYNTFAGSGVPNVGAPVCIDIELAKLPKITGTPGFIICVKAIPDMASAKICVRVPATETGDMAPARIKGDTIQACPARA